MRRTGGEHVACCLAWRRAWLPTGYRLCPRCPVRPRAPAHSGRLSRLGRAHREPVHAVGPTRHGCLPPAGLLPAEALPGPVPPARLLGRAVVVRRRSAPRDERGRNDQRQPGAAVHRRDAAGRAAGRDEAAARAKRVGRPVGGLRRADGRAVGRHAPAHDPRPASPRDRRRPSRGRGISSRSRTGRSHARRPRGLPHTTRCCCATTPRRFRRDGLRFFLSTGGSHGAVKRSWTFEFERELRSLGVPSRLWSQPPGGARLRAQPAALGAEIRGANRLLSRGHRRGLATEAAVSQLAELGEREEDDRAKQTDAPLRARQRHRVEDPLQRAE